jgi:hypothetical protein
LFDYLDWNHKKIFICKARIALILVFSISYFACKSQPIKAFNKKDADIYDYFNVSLDLLSATFDFKSFFELQSHSCTYKLFLGNENIFSRFIVFFKRDPFATHFTKTVTVKRIYQFGDHRGFPAEQGNNLIWLNKIKKYCDYFYCEDYFPQAKSILHYSNTGYLDSVEVFDMKCGKYIKSWVMKFAYPKKPGKFCVRWNFSGNKHESKSDFQLELGKRQTFSFRYNNIECQYAYIKEGVYSYRKYDIKKQELQDSIVMFTEHKTYKSGHIQLTGYDISDLMKNIISEWDIKYVRYQNLDTITILKEIVFLDQYDNAVIRIEQKLIDPVSHYYIWNSSFSSTNFAKNIVYVFSGPCSYQQNQSVGYLVPIWDNWRLKRSELKNGDVTVSTESGCSFPIDEESRNEYEIRIMKSVINHNDSLDLLCKDRKGTSSLYHWYDKKTFGYLFVHNQNRSYYLFTL